MNGVMPKKYYKLWCVINRQVQLSKVICDCIKKKQPIPNEWKKEFEELYKFMTNQK